MRHAALVQARLQGEAQGVRHEGRHDDDLLRRHPTLMHQTGDVPGGPVDHLRMPARPRGPTQGRAAIAAPGGRLAIPSQGLRQGVMQRGDVGRHGAAPLQRDGKVAERLQGAGLRRVRAQKAAQTRLAVANQQGRVTLRQPVAQQVVQGRRILLQIIDQHMPVAPRQVTAGVLQGPELLAQDVHEQRKVDQVVSQAAGAKETGAGLGVVVDEGLFRRAAPGRLQARADLFRREAHQRRLVEVVDDLRVQAVAADRHAAEVIAPFNFIAHETPHQVLREFQTREAGRRQGLRAARVRGDERPEELQQFPRQAAQGRDAHLGGAGRPRATQGILPGQAGGLLRHQHQNGGGRRPGVQELLDPFNAGGRLARAGEALQEDPAVQVVSRHLLLFDQEVHTLPRRSSVSV